MRLYADRFRSASRVLASAALSLMGLQFAACSPDSPGVVSPAGLPTSFDVLDLSNGSVVAEVKSAWLDSKCIGIRNASMYDGARAELQPCRGGAAQEFEFTSTGLVRVGGTYCLDAYSGNGNAGDRIVIWGCHGRANQQWQLTSAGEIRGINGLCVSFKGHPNDGTTLYIDTCSGSADQKWIEEVTSSTPTIPTSPTPGPAASVTVSLSSGSGSIGQTAQATATVRDANGNALTGQTVSWTSSSSSVASVTAAGLITALTAGTTTVVATTGGVSGSATYTVSAPTIPLPPGGGSCSFVTGTVTKATTALGKPGYLESVIEPDFGTTIIRITGDPGTPIGNGVSGTWPTTAYPNYPKDAVWTADQKLMVLKHMSGALGAGWSLVLDGTTYQPLWALGAPNGGGEWRLHPTLPDIAVYANPTGAIGHWNIRTKVSTVKVPALAGYGSAEIGPSEGNVSKDGRYIAVKAVRSSDGHVVAMVADIDAGTRGPIIDLTAANVTNLDWVSISAGGNYVVAYATIDGAVQRTKVWSATTGALVGYWQDYTFGHYDLGLDASGNDVAFGAVGQAPYAHHYIARRLDTGSITDLTGAAVTSYNWHASVRATARAGWALGVTNDKTGYPYDGEIYGIKLDGSKTIERYAHHRAVVTDYDANPFPTPSPDGKRIVFASNWGVSGGRPVQTYVIDTRPLCP